MDEDRIVFEGEIVEMPITIKDLVEEDQKLSKAFAYLKQITDPDMYEALRWAVSMAADFVCNLCHERNVDPMALDWYDEKYDMIVTDFKPFNFWGQDDDPWYPPQQS